jgi:hypothetical protein
MADTAKGVVSMTPVVTIAADADADAVDAIHHDIKTTLGGALEYAKVDANDKWFYNASRDLTATSANLISGDFTEGGTAATTDDVRYLFVKHSGTIDGTTAVASGVKVYLNLDGSDAASVANVMELGANEAICLKLKAATGVDVENLHAATSSGTVRCTVAAIIDDGG